MPAGVKRRFSDLDAESIDVEHHVHTIYTDGQGTIEEVLAEANRRNLRSLAFTEHVRRDTDWFGRFVDEVRRVAEGYPDIRVLVGCEAKALNRDGELDVSEDILAEVDLVLGSVHRVPDERGAYVDYRALEASACADLELEYAMGLAVNTVVDVLAHPGGMTQRIHGFFPREHFEAIMCATAESGVAMEISSSYLREPLGFLDLCHSFNPIVSIGSDVHRVESIGECRELVRSFLSRRTPIPDILKK